MFSSEVGPAPSHSSTRGAEKSQHYADDQEDDADGRQQRDLCKYPDEDQDDSEDDHVDSQSHASETLQSTRGWGRVRHCVDLLSVNAISVRLSIQDCEDTCRP